MDGEFKRDLSDANEFISFELDFSYWSECDGKNEMIWGVKEATPEKFEIEYSFQDPECIREFLIGQGETKDTFKMNILDPSIFEGAQSGKAAEYKVRSEPFMIPKPPPVEVIKSPVVKAV